MGEDEFEHVFSKVGYGMHGARCRAIDSSIRREILTELHEKKVMSLDEMKNRFNMNDFGLKHHLGILALAGFVKFDDKECRITKTGEEINYEYWEMWKLESK